MSHKDELTNLVGSAVAEVNAVPTEQQAGNAEGFERLKSVLGYAEVVVAATDAALVSAEARASVGDALYNVENEIGVAGVDLARLADGVLNALHMLPVALGRTFEQEAKAAAMTFQRSATARLKDLQERCLGLAQEIKSLTESLETSAQERSDEFHAKKAVLNDQLIELGERITAQQTALDEQLTRHSQTFTTAEEERSGAFQKELQTAHQSLEATRRRVQRELEERVTEIRRMEAESAALVGAIGLAGTAERFSEEAETQKRVADRFRWLTILLALGAVGVAFYAVVTGGTDDPERLVAKLAVSLVLGALASYTAQQSGRHRRREEKSRTLQLELTAFAPFIEPLSEAQQEEERVVMARKSFGRLAGASFDDPGPNPVSLLLQRFKESRDPEAE